MYSPSEGPNVNIHRLQALIDEGGYESAQFQLYLTELERINPDVIINNLIINGLYELTKSRARDKQGAVYDDRDGEKIDIRHAVKSHASDSLMLARYWLEPSQPEEMGLYNAIGSSFVEFVCDKFGNSGLRDLICLIDESVTNPDEFVFRGCTISELEYKWRKHVENSASAHSRMSVFQFISCLFTRYFKLHWFIVLLMLLFSCCDVAARLSTSILIGWLFDIVADSNSSASDLLNPGYQLVAVWCAEIAIAVVHTTLSGWMAVQIAGRLREELFSKIHRVRPAFFLNNSSASILSCFSSDIEAIETVTANTLSLCLQAFLLILMSLGFLLSMDWRLTLGLVAMVMIFQLPIIVIARKASYHHFNKSQAFGKLLSMMKENVDGYQVNWLYRLELYWNASFSQLLHSKYAHQAVRSLRFTFALQTISMLYPNFVVVVYLIAAGVLIKLELFTYSKMLAMYTMAVFSATGTIVLGRSVSQVARAAAGMGRLQAFLSDTSGQDVMETVGKEIQNKSPDIERLSISHPLASLPISQDSPTVELRNVSFCYESHSSVWNLYDVSLTIPFGQSVALVGASGSGKSTVLSIIMNMYVPTEGEVLIDGKRIQDISPEDLPFGVALQENYLFNTTICENIRMGRLGASDQDVEDAARAAGIHQFITKLPLQYDTLAGERGALLSGGQRQRIAFARMLIRRPKVLLLDEVASSLDAVSEQKVFATIRKLFRHHTVVYVTHKLSQAQPADRIVVMSHGKLKEEGNHDELINKQGVYHRLWLEQQQAESSSKSSVSGRDEDTAGNSLHSSVSSSLSSSHSSHSYNTVRKMGSTVSISSPQVLNFLLDDTEADGPYVPSHPSKPTATLERRHTLPHLFLHRRRNSFSVHFSTPEQRESSVLDSRSSDLKDRLRRTVSDPVFDVSICPVASGDLSRVEKTFIPACQLKSKETGVDSALTMPDRRSVDQRQVESLSRMSDEIAAKEVFHTVEM